MTRDKKIISVLAILLIALTVIGGCTAKRLQYQRDLAQTGWDKEKQTASTWRDNAGRARAEVQSISAEKDIIKTVYESEIDSLRKAIPDIGKNGKGLIESTNVTTQVRDSVVLKEVYDTVVVNNNILTQRSYQYSDKWAQFKLTDNVLDYSFTDSLSIVKFRKKQGFLKPRITSVQVISHNPRVSVTGLTQFEVQEKERKIDLGLQVGYGFTQHGLGLYAGVGLTWRPWR